MRHVSLRAVGPVLFACIALGLGCNQDPMGSNWVQDSGQAADADVETPQDTSYRGVDSSDVGPDGTEDARDGSGADASDGGPDADPWYEDFCETYNEDELWGKIQTHRSESGDWTFVVDEELDYQELTLPDSVPDSTTAAAIHHPEPSSRMKAGFIINMPLEGSWPDGFVDAFDGSSAPLNLESRDRGVSQDRHGHNLHFVTGDREADEETRISPGEFRNELVRRLLDISETADLAWPPATVGLRGYSPYFTATAIRRPGENGNPDRLVVLGAAKTFAVTDGGINLRELATHRNVGFFDEAISAECRVQTAHQAPDVDIFTFVSNRLSGELRQKTADLLGETAESIKLSNWVDPRYGVLSMEEGRPLGTEGVEWSTTRDGFGSAFQNAATLNSNNSLAPIERAMATHKQTNSTYPRYLLVSNKLSSRELSGSEKQFLENEAVVAIEPEEAGCGSASFEGPSLYDEWIQGDQLSPRVFDPCPEDGPDAALATNLSGLQDVPRAARAYRLPGRIGGTGVIVHPDISSEYVPGPFGDPGYVYIEEFTNWVQLAETYRPDWPVDDEIERIGFTYLKWSDSEETP
jgi:hypothetical protein